MLSCYVVSPDAGCCRAFLITKKLSALRLALYWFPPSHPHQWSMCVIHAWLTPLGFPHSVCCKSACCWPTCHLPAGLRSLAVLSLPRSWSSIPTSQVPAPPPPPPTQGPSAASSHLCCSFLSKSGSAQGGTESQRSSLSTTVASCPKCRVQALRQPLVVRTGCCLDLTRALAGCWRLCSPSSWCLWSWWPQVGPCWLGHPRPEHGQGAGLR